MYRDSCEAAHDGIHDVMCQVVHTSKAGKKGNGGTYVGTTTQSCSNGKGHSAGCVTRRQTFIGGVLTQYRGYDLEVFLSFELGIIWVGERSHPEKRAFGKQYANETWHPETKWVDSHRKELWIVNQSMTDCD